MIILRKICYFWRKTKWPVKLRPARAEHPSRRKVGDTGREVAGTKRCLVLQAMVRIQILFQDYRKPLKGFVQRGNQVHSCFQKIILATMLKQAVEERECTQKATVQVDEHLVKGGSGGCTKLVGWIQRMRGDKAQRCLQIKSLSNCRMQIPLRECREPGMRYRKQVLGEILRVVNKAKIHV